MTGREVVGLECLCELLLAGHRCYCRDAQGRHGVLGAAPRTGAEPVPRAVCSRKTQLWCCCLVHGEAHHVLSSLCCPQLAVTLGAGTWGWGGGTVPCIPGNGAKGSTSFSLMPACVGSPQTPLTLCCHTDWGKRTHLREINLCKEGPRRKKRCISHHPPALFPCPGPAHTPWGCPVPAPSCSRVPAHPCTACPFPGCCLPPSAPIAPRQPWLGQSGGTGVMGMAAAPADEEATPGKVEEASRSCFRQGGVGTHHSSLPALGKHKPRRSRALAREESSGEENVLSESRLPSEEEERGLQNKPAIFSKVSVAGALLRESHS